MGRCIDDYSTHCAGYGCNACGRYESTCANCRHAEDMSSTDRVMCEIDEKQHKENDGCKRFKPI